MCGLTGFWQPGAAKHGIAGLACSMADRIAHRGPDDSGTWVDEASGLAQAHRRLSIVDLSAAGHQLTLSANGHYVLAYNGEFYNQLELRRELEAAHAAPAWRGHSGKSCCEQRAAQFTEARARPDRFEALSDLD